MTQQYSNIAFISYKREDEKWAKWLQKKLEHYKLPTEIRKQNPDLEFAKNPRHVFKDTTDLSGGVLAKAIKEGLASSKYLVVICSPHAAKSEWVCKEVQDFIDSGREEYIIPFIIDGEPYAKNPENDCFPEALKTLAGERELLGININENGRESAAVKVVARLFDLRFDILWDRFQREANKRRRYKVIGLVSLVLFSSMVATWIGWLYYQQNTKNIIITKNYYRQTAKQALLDIKEGNTLKSIKALLEVAVEDEKSALYVSEVENALRIAFDSLYSMNSFKTVDFDYLEAWITRSGKYLVMSKDDGLSIYDLSYFSRIGSIYGDLVFFNRDESRFAIVADSLISIYKTTTMRVDKTFDDKKDDNEYKKLTNYRLVTRKKNHKFITNYLLENYICSIGFDGALDFNPAKNLALLYKYRHGKDSVQVSLVNTITNKVVWKSKCFDKYNIVYRNHSFVFSHSGNKFVYHEDVSDSISCVQVVNTESLVKEQFSVYRTYEELFLDFAIDEDLLYYYSYNDRHESPFEAYNLETNTHIIPQNTIGYYSDNENVFIIGNKIYFRKEHKSPLVLEYSSNKWEYDYEQEVLTIKGMKIPVYQIGPSFCNYPMEDTLIVNDKYLTMIDGSITCLEAKTNVMLWSFTNDLDYHYQLWTNKLFGNKYVILESHDVSYENNICYLIDLSTGMEIKRWRNVDNILVDNKNNIYTSNFSENMEVQSTLYRYRFLSYTDLLSLCRKEVKDITLSQYDRSHYFLK